MLIKDLEIAAVEVPLLGTYKTAHNTRTTLKSVIVRVHGDNGLEGIGNIDPAPGYMKETVADVVQKHQESVPTACGKQRI